MSERRSHDRVSLDRAITVQLSSGRTIQARLVNLSSTGLCLAYPAPPELGATLGLHFQLPDKDMQVVSIQCRGVARHTHVCRETFISGFEFCDIKPEDQTVIDQFIKRKRSSLNHRFIVK